MLVLQLMLAQSSTFLACISGQNGDNKTNCSWRLKSVGHLDMSILGVSKSLELCILGASETSLFVMGQSI
jgi:hypothetical protein